MTFKGEKSERRDTYICIQVLVFSWKEFYEWLLMIRNACMHDNVMFVSKCFIIKTKRYQSCFAFFALYIVSLSTLKYDSSIV